MPKKKLAIWVIVALLVSGGSYVTWAAIRAHRNLVTLNVRDMDVRKVISKLEWQTCETIIPDKSVKGKVTLNVRKVPLETVLDIIGEQIESRSTTVYPLYSSSRSMGMLHRALRGEVEAQFVGWTNLQRRGFGGGPFGGPGGSGGRGGPGGPGGPAGFGRGGPDFGRGGGFFGEMMQTNRSSVVSLDLRGKDVQFAATALSRFGGVRVVSDDKLHKTVNLRVNQVPVETAIARLAKSASAKWDKIYALRGDEGPRQFADRGEGDRRDRFRELSEAEREEMRRQRQEAEEQLMQTISAEERAKLEEARKEREKMFQEMASLTPEQRRERFQQMGGAMREQRNLDRIKSTTPEQRVERYREMNERRKRFQESGQRPGEGRRGPGGPGGRGESGGPPPRP